MVGAFITATSSFRELCFVRIGLGLVEAETSQNIYAKIKFLFNTSNKMLSVNLLLINLKLHLPKL